MPTLEWIGKDKVLTHHMDVPYRVLDKKYTYGAENAGNMIIHGDNLEAMKSLLPGYEGRIDCVYIDPPYNTGAEGWVYNDNVNDPQILKWLGQTVGPEGEDLSRHDKWLCMMYPRLRLLHSLLSESGAIFISIDDNELYSLKLICDEIFGAQCFVGDISWQRTYSTRNDSKGIVVEVEHLLVYGKRPGWQPQKLERTEKSNAMYSHLDPDGRAWSSDNAFAPGARTHQGMVYAIQHPFTGELLYPTSGQCWRYQQSDMLAIMNGWTAYERRDIGDEEKRAEICGVPVETVRKDVTALMLVLPKEDARREAQSVYDSGWWPKFYFTKGGQGGMRRKTYLEEVSGPPPTNLWPYTEVGHTDEAAKTLKALFDGAMKFQNPKPPRLIERILQIAGGPGLLILDSFAGSGTTAQAVLSANARDGGNRRFILIEKEDYAEDITAERVKRVISGYSQDTEAVLFDREITFKDLANGPAIVEEAKQARKEAKDRFSKVSIPKICDDGHVRVVGTQKAADKEPGLGGGFTFYELGEPLIEDGMLNDNVDAAAIREYVWYTETGQTGFMPPQSPNPYFLGEHAGTALYFFYEPDRMTTLDPAFLVACAIQTPSSVIYADTCTVSEQTLLEKGITFKKIPRDIARL